MRGALHLIIVLAAIVVAHGSHVAALVAWTGAAGGALRLDRRGPAAPSPPGTPLAVAAGLGAAAVHLAAAPAHFDESLAYGVFFVGLSGAQAAWALTLARRPSAALLRAGAIGSAAVIVLWLCSRVVGLPVGPDAAGPEAVGWADAVATALEGLIVVTAVLPLGHGSIRRPMLGLLAVASVATVVWAPLT